MQKSRTLVDHYSFLANFVTFHQYTTLIFLFSLKKMKVVQCKCITIFLYIQMNECMHYSLLYLLLVSVVYCSLTQSCKVFEIFDQIYLNTFKNLKQLIIKFIVIFDNHYSLPVFII